MNFRIIRDHDGLRSISGAWNDLFDRSLSASVMQSYGWISAYLASDCFCTDGWGCAIAEEAKRTVAVLPFQQQVGGALGETSITYPISGHLNICDVLLADDADDQILVDLLRFVMVTIPRTAYIDLPRVPSYSRTLSILANTNELSFLNLGPSYSGAFVAPVPCYAEYEKSLSRNFRSNLSKARNKLKDFSEYRVEVLQRGTPVRHALSRFAALEDSGWKHDAGTSIASVPGLFDFYEDALVSLDESGLVEWHFLSADDIDLAGHVAFRTRDRLVLWKLGYQEQYRKMSPGSLLLAEVIAMESTKHDGVEIDMTTEQPWYENWKMRNRPYAKIRIYNRRTFAGALYWLLDRSRILARSSPTVRRIVRKIRRLG